MWDTTQYEQIVQPPITARERLRDLKEKGQRKLQIFKQKAKKFMQTIHDTLNEGQD